MINDDDNRDHGKSFLNDFLGGSKPEDLTKNAVEHDDWDAEDYDHILSEMKELNAAEDRLTDIAETGSPMMADAFYSLVKADPQLTNARNIRPKYLVNRAVMGEIHNLKELEELRLYSVGDEIAAGLACAKMEPTIEEIYDKLAQDQKLADELEEMMKQMQGLSGEMGDIDKMIDAATDEESAQDMQQQKSLIQAQMELLKQSMENTAAELDQSLNEKTQSIRMMAKEMIGEALEATQDLDSMAQAWGLDPGALHKMPAKDRLELAQRLNTEKFRRIAKLFGPMSRLAFAEQSRKTNFSRDEVYDIENGNDLFNLLPTELALLDDEDMEMDFYRRYIEGELLQYKLRGTEKVAKGGIIFCEDGSGSMAGEREIWAKAVGLCLLHVAKSQIRSFYGIHFGGTGMIKEFDFTDTTKITIDNVIEFAEIFFNGGTDFMTPLSRALELLQKQFDEDGCVSGDIVFCTDGYCGVDEEWLQAFKEEQERLGFRVWGISIGGSPESEPLQTICDGRVFTIQNLVNGNEIREIFKGI